MKQSLFTFFFKFLWVALFALLSSMAAGQQKKVNDLIEKAINSYETLKYEEAIDFATRAIKLRPDIAIAHDLRGFAQFQLGKPDAAIKDITEAIRLNPVSALFYFHRGTVYLDTKNYVSAISDLSKAIQIDPKLSDAYQNRGSAYSKVGLYDQAFNDYTSCISSNSEITLDCYRNRSIISYRRGEFDKAIADITQAITIDPTFVLGYDFRSAVYMALGKYNQAISDLEKVIALDPRYHEAYINIMTALIHTGEDNKAKQYYQAFKNEIKTPRSRDPKFVSNEEWKFYGHYVTALTEGVFAGNFETALKELGIAEQIYSSEIVSTHIKNETKSGFIDILFLKGYVFEQLGQFTEARNAYEQTLILNKNWNDLPVAVKRIEKRETVAIKQDKTPPVITISEPDLSRSFDIVTDNKQRVAGKVYDKAGLLSVTVNGQKVTSLTDNGSFMHDMAFAEGRNTLNISAIDKNGNKASQSFIFTAKKTTGKRNPPAQKQESPVPEDITYHAILIAEQDYKDNSIQSLKHPAEDARDLKKILEASYNFKPENTLLLENKTREEILNAVIAKCNTLKETDNLLIFYAGHGVATEDRKYRETNAYWIPISAIKGQESTYITFDDIKKSVKRSFAKHILIIADACFGGALVRSLPADAPAIIGKQYQLESRKAMTSASMEATPDNSIFFRYLKIGLEDNKEKYLPADDLFQSFKKAVQNLTGNLPLHTAIPGTGDNNGDFIFIRK